MPWIYAVVGLIVGAISGGLLVRLMTPNYQAQQSLQKQLDNTKFEIEQRRQELADHFAQTAEILDSLGKDYTKLYQHMAKTSSSLLPNVPAQDNPFEKLLIKTTEPENTTPLEEQPKDYALGATGLLKVQERAIIHSADIVQTKVTPKATAASE